MQHDPEKIHANFNEINGEIDQINLPRGIFQISNKGEEPSNEVEELIQKGVFLVNEKVNRILGQNNKLTQPDLLFPTIDFINSCPEYPNFAGYFESNKNKIVIISDISANIPGGPFKVFIHEYVHFLSHNGRDTEERVGVTSPISSRNNVGFRRYAGLDIRAGREGAITSDYFLSFNEAVTEQFTIDVLPGTRGVYEEYRDLLNRVITDAIAYGIGSKNSSGDFKTWSRENIKNYIYACYFSGNLAGFTSLLQTIYSKYDISEAEFGLMTHRDDLPTSVERTIWVDPRQPPPSPESVAELVRQRINQKSPEEYVTDVINVKLSNIVDLKELQIGDNYDKYIKNHGITYSHSEVIADNQFDFDNSGKIIYRGSQASLLFKIITEELDSLLERNVDTETVSARINELLFDTYQISMLSEGFRNFYIYKHSKID